jgi:hypothetical protein
MNLMKQRSTTPVSQGLVTRSAIVAAAVLVMIASTPVLVPRVYADKFDDQINALQNEINQYESLKLGHCKMKLPVSTSKKILFSAKLT